MGTSRGRGARARRSVRHYPRRSLTALRELSGRSRGAATLAVQLGHVVNAITQGTAPTQAAAEDIGPVNEQIQRYKTQESGFLKRLNNVEKYLNSFMKEKIVLNNVCH